MPRPAGRGANDAGKDLPLSVQGQVYTTTAVQIKATVKRFVVLGLPRVVKRSASKLRLCRRKATGNQTLCAALVSRFLLSARHERTARLARASGNENKAR